MKWEFEMIKKIFKIFNKKSEDELLLAKVKKLPLDKFFLTELERHLQKNNFENIDICDGEHITIERSLGLECCIDVYFEKDYLYMLTVYEDGIILLKNKNKIFKIDNYLIEDVDYEEIYKRKLDKSIISSLRTIHKIA